MIAYLIILGIILICFIIIAVVIVKKFSQLSSLDLEAMKQHKHKQVKVSIVEERLERKFKEFRKKIALILIPVKDKIKQWIKKFYHKILRLEKEFKEQESTKLLKQEDKEVLRQKIGSLVRDAEELIEQDKLSEAEKKYIEAIGLDKQNIETYKGLGELYISKKDYEHALETFEFVKQINPNDDVLWRQLGSVCKALNNTDKSVKCYKKAVDLAPNNPKNLDLLIEISIKADDRFLAQDTLKKLEEVNPDNQKLEEYKKQIKEL